MLGALNPKNLAREACPFSPAQRFCLGRYASRSPSTVSSGAMGLARLSWGRLPEGAAASSPSPWDLFSAPTLLAYLSISDSLAYTCTFPPANHFVSDVT